MRKSQFIYRNVEIGLTDRGMFIASVGDISISVPSLEDVHIKIDKALSDTASSKTLDLKVIGFLRKWGENKDPNAQIHRAVLVGVNRTTGEITFSGVPKGYSFGPVLPDVGGAEEFLVFYKEKAVEWGALQERMNGYRLSNPKSGRVLAENYEELLNKLDETWSLCKHQILLDMKK